MVIYPINLGDEVKEIRIKLVVPCLVLILVVSLFIWYSAKETRVVKQGQPVFKQD